MNDRTFYVGKVSARFEQAKKRLRSERKIYTGLLYIDHSGEQYKFPKGDRNVKTVLENVDRQPQNAFEVFTNLNNQVVVKEVTKLPHFHIV